MALHDQRFLKQLATALVNHPRASMKELAQWVGVSKATLNRHYGTRANLEQQLESHAKEVLARITSSTELHSAEPLDALHHLITEHLAHRDLVALLMFESRPNTSIQENEAFYLEKLDAFFLRGQQQGVFRIDISAAAFTELFINLIHGMVDAERRGRAASSHSAHTLAQVFLHGGVARKRPVTRGTRPTALASH
ncbi:TetR/AcrR family transcriptional regulator [Pseudomonas sp. NPDC089530]|uniref:TetR/AcrR family transcriptional regulator n=1 Tax=Pseudomonas sp. NPDC089530 TaxID=3390651 RepID=UPI003CFBEB30